MNKSDEYYTPKWIFDTLKIQFDLDVAAPRGGVIWLPATNHFSIENNGLTQQWTGKVWMNPPFSKPTPWVEKFIAHANGVALLPYSKSNWFDKLWQVADGLATLTPRLKFEHVDTGTTSILMPCLLVSMGEVCTNALKMSQLGRVR